MKEKILKYLRDKDKISVTMSEMARDLGLSAAKDFRELVKLIAIMEKEALVDFTDLGTISLHSLDPELTGIFRANQAGFGFVTISDDEPDIFIARDQTGSAMEGDEVGLVISKAANPLTRTSAEGKVVSVKKRAWSRIVGTFKATDKDRFIGELICRDKKFNWQILVTDRGLKASENQVVAAEILEFPNEKHPDSVTVLLTKIIGSAEDKGIDVLEILEGMGIRNEFPEEVQQEVATIPREISESELQNREDFRDEIVYTIDGADAKDLDDAIHVKLLENGNYELGVHIADVSHYVKLGTALDKEALERGTSVYVTDRVVPMLPEELSNGICSLNPQVDRLVQSCIMEIDQTGTVIRERIIHAVIKTTYRMTYDDVNLMFDGNEETLALFPKIVEPVRNALKLHKILEKMRKNRGALEFSENEAKILVDENGLPVEIVKRERGLAERMIESFMLAANETVAEHYTHKNLPFIYRIHEEPKSEKVQAFIDLASSFGLAINGTAAHIEQKDLQDFSRRIAGQPYEPVLSKLMLRSMQQARYSENEVGHFGLAAEYYTHFTSPIRRYPDLLVHRLIDEYEGGASKDQQKLDFWQAKIPEIASQSSSRERRAVDAERTVDKMKKAEFMMAFIDTEFDGVVSSVTSFGAFIELSNTVEGLMHINSFKKEYLRYDERSLSLHSEKTGLTLRIGSPIRIKVRRADKITGEIDFEYVKSELDKFEKTVKIEKNNKDRRKSKDKGKDKKTDKPFHQHQIQGAKDKFEKGGDKKKKSNQPYYKKVAKKSQKRHNGPSKKK
ncbi:MAG: ribonuclease R [Streptococcaceae bacterium]|jgi:ribonuclease R|nr:ribonuclease R [Streptococcaceae bacterium]